MPSAICEQLLCDTLPQAIETNEQYRQVGARFGDLVGKGRSRTPDETKLMRLLALLSRTRNAAARSRAGKARLPQGTH